MTHIQLLLEKEPEGGRANLYWLLSKRNHFPFGPRIDVSWQIYVTHTQIKTRLSLRL